MFDGGGFFLCLLILAGIPGGPAGLTGLCLLFLLLKLAISQSETFAVIERIVAFYLY